MEKFNYIKINSISQAAAPM